MTHELPGKYGLQGKGAATKEAAELVRRNAARHGDDDG